MKELRGLGAPPLVWLLLGCAALGCASPAGVRRVDAREVQHTLTANVLSTGEPSVPSRQVLQRMGLGELFEDDPVAAVSALQTSRLDDNEVFALADLKRLGIFLGPIVLVNTAGFFDSLLVLLERAVAERFMDERHLAIWQTVAEPEQVPAALAAAKAWSAAARHFARP